MNSNLCALSSKGSAALAAAQTIFGVILIEKSKMLVDRVATKSMDSRGDWGRISVRQRSGQTLYANWLEILPCPAIWNIWCYFSANRMILVDRVATKSMDSREEWGRTSVRQRSGQKLCATLVGNASLP